METTITTHSVEETKELGRRVSHNLVGGENLFLVGDLGCGKTALTQGIAAGLGIPRPVKSPTFTYLQEYAVPMRSTKLAHFDLYRLPEKLSEHDLQSIDLPERVTDIDTIAVVEWADKLLALMKEKHAIVRFRIGEDGTRQITLPKKLLRIAG